MTDGVTLGRLSDLTGVPRGTLHYWRRVGLISAVSDAEGDVAEPARYDLKNVRVALTVAELRERGVSLQKIRKASGRLQQYDEDLASASLYTDGDHVYHFQPRTQVFVDLTQNPTQLGLKALFPIEGITPEARDVFESRDIA